MAERSTGHVSVLIAEKETAGRVVSVPVGALCSADSPRLGGVDLDHARALAEVTTGLPPILVHRRTMTVIDGMHRLTAARMNGRECIEVQFFDGSVEDSFRRVQPVEAFDLDGLGGTGCPPCGRC